ncbi:glycosyltransferase family 4 protein [Phenylobacterium sp.]|uniref:glycosyltransferase family 4 protein n=1 Tax=Phenylobacterium sp. TaxID=1871053 RepID=UPI0025CF058E|nr:glycosyltransferase family 4 protein [Phenylobacterium sp.]
MSEPLQSATIRAEPDAFDVSRPQLMGRHTAGHGFLRAAVAARGDGPIHGYAPTPAAARGFEAIVREIDPAARTAMVQGTDLAGLGDPGVLYLGDVTVPTFARLRLRQGVAAFSLCGVTHTTASSSSMDATADLLREPIAPWDALVCTSTAVLETIRRVQAAEADYLRWRLGEAVRIEGPQLPVIPLGVHCADFDFSPADRTAARAALGLEPDEVAGLYVGRLLFHGKAHPLPMYQALQAAAERTGQRVALVMSGWAPNSFIEDAFVRGAAEFAPDVRTIFVDGRETSPRRHAWAGSDIFFSLSDGIQETFGLTPIEAKAAGLPLIVSDWNGYRDTVRSGVDGFRISTWAPTAGAGQSLALAFEAGVMSYDLYGWAAAATTSVDLSELCDCVSLLVANPPLRRRMGDAARLHAREVYDWPSVYRVYQALWGELDARRRHALADPVAMVRWSAAPRVTPRRLDPFDAFGHYPTFSLGPRTLLSPAEGASMARFEQIAAHPLFWEVAMPHEMTQALMALALHGPVGVADAAATLALNVTVVIRSAGLLAKMGLIRLSAG